MSAEIDPTLRRLRWIFWGLVLLLVLWQFLPWIERYLIGMTAEPRSVTARGDLAGDEIAVVTRETGSGTRAACAATWASQGARRWGSTRANASLFNF